jgi:hypothetical protein
LYSGIINVYDLRRFDPSTNKTRIEIYLNRPEVRQALHVSEGSAKHRYTTCSKTVVYMHLKYDILHSVKHLIPFLMNHMQVYFYNGNFDLQDGPVGTEQFLYTLDLPNFKQARRDLWFDGDHVAGYSQTDGNLTFVTIHGAGHFVPTDQPHSSLAMIRNFITGKPFCDGVSSIPVTHSTLTPAEFDKYLEQDKHTNKTLLPCNIQQVGCRVTCENGDCIDGSCVCRPNWAGEDCGSVITPTQRITRTVMLPQEWRFFKFKGSPSKRNLVIDIKVDNTTEIPEPGKYYVGHGIGTNAPTKVCVYVNEGGIPSHLDFLHVTCLPGVSSFPAPRGDGVVGIFNGARHGVRTVLRSTFVSRRVARYAFHVAFNTKFFLLFGSVGTAMIVIIAMCTLVGRGARSSSKPKIE